MREDITNWTDRRSVLKAAGAAGLVSLAGCVSTTEDEGNGNGNGNDGNGNGDGNGNVTALEVPTACTSWQYLGIVHMTFVLMYQ